MLIKFLSSVGTGSFHVGEKNVKNATRKVALRKFDPIVNRYVIYNEFKLKSGKKK